MKVKKRRRRILPGTVPLCQEAQIPDYCAVISPPGPVRPQVVTPEVCLAVI